MHIVIIGNSIAADCLIEELGRHTSGPALDITVIGDEPHRAYNRVLLSQVLSGDVSDGSIALRTPNWQSNHRIRYRQGLRVEEIDRAAQQVALDNGEQLPYDRLVLATGARASLPKGVDPTLHGVRVFRTLDDAHTLINTPKGSHTIVFGGGLLGLEAAAGLLSLGVRVTLVHRNAWLLNRQLDRAAGRLLLANLQRRGLLVELGSTVSAVEGDRHVRAVRLDSGRCLSATQIVFATGITPRAELALAAGLPVNRGVMVDDHLQSPDPCVFALGECAECSGETVGLVSPIRDQAKVLARTLLGQSGAPYTHRAHAAQLKVAGIDVFSAGDVNHEGEQTMVFDDPLTPARRKLVLENGRLKAIMLFGDVRDGPWFNALMQKGIDTRALHDRLLFGKAYCEGLAA